ncbi:MAG: plasmid pRiA4b ORF-3 family protein [Methylococcales bacterium]|nr:plasmid pRiA4b ORF-3 family protein [Methylococcales bacterium]
MATKQTKAIYQIKISLKGAKPPIWRRVLVPSTMKLNTFHGVVQTAMGWENYHLHQFEFRQTYYGVPDEEFEMENESKYKLSQLLTHEKESMNYIYDFGDNWQHKILLEKILPFDDCVTLPLCIKGNRACPPEDCGGIWGYVELLETLADPKHPQHEEMLEWLGDEFDPEAFDLAEINYQLISRFK